MARAYDGVAEAYARCRPSYPDAAVRWLVGDEPARVLDLGAGTGQLTHGVHQLGHRVVAVEPSAQMVAQLTNSLSVPCVRAHAESLPFADTSVDVVVVGQAFHWFDPEALAQLARVLRSGGALGLVCNVPDASIPWTRRLLQIIGSSTHDLSEYAQEPPMSGLFSVAEHKEFSFWHRLDNHALVDLVRTRSYVAALGDPERDRVLDQVRELYARHCAEHGVLQMRYLTRCYRSRRV